MPQPTYKLVYLSKADGDLREIVTYIAVELAAPAAANRFLDQLQQAISQLMIFPYAHPVYRGEVSTEPLEFRRLVVGSYLVFYYVTNEEVVVARVLYAKRDVQEHLQQNEFAYDPFYSEANQTTLKKSIAKAKAGKGRVEKTLEELEVLEND